MSTLDSRHAFTGPSAAPEKPPGVRDRMPPSSLQGGIHEVNRRQARQGELRSKRRSPGGEGTLGYSVSCKGMSTI